MSDSLSTIWSSFMNSPPAPFVLARMSVRVCQQIRYWDLRCHRHHISPGLSIRQGGLRRSRCSCKKHIKNSTARPPVYRRPCCFYSPNQFSVSQQKEEGETNAGTSHRNRRPMERSWPLQRQQRDFDPSIFFRQRRPPSARKSHVR